MQVTWVPWTLNVWLIGWVNLVEIEECVWWFDMVKEAREMLEKVVKEEWGLSRWRRWDWSGRVQKSVLEMGRGWEEGKKWMEAKVAVTSFLSSFPVRLHSFVLSTLIYWEPPSIQALGLQHEWKCEKKNPCPLGAYILAGGRLTDRQNTLDVKQC